MEKSGANIIESPLREAPARPSPSGLTTSTKASPARPATPPAPRPVPVVRQLPPDEHARELAGPRWENVGPGWRTYLATVMQVALRPQLTFRSLRGDVGGFPASWFALVTAILVSAVHVVWVVAFAKAGWQTGELGLMLNQYWVASHDPIGAILLGSIVASVAAMAFVLFMVTQAAIMNSLLNVLGSPAESLEITYRAVAFSYGATGTIALIPVVGPVLALLAQIPYHAWGASAVSGAPLARAIVASVLMWITVALVMALGWALIVYLPGATSL